MNTRSNCGPTSGKAELTSSSNPSPASRPYRPLANVATNRRRDGVVGGRDFDKLDTGADTVFRVTNPSDVTDNAAQISALANPRLAGRRRWPEVVGTSLKHRHRGGTVTEAGN